MGNYIGFTHYWSRKGKVSETAYKAAITDIIKIVKTVTNKSKLAKTLDIAPIALANGQGESNTAPELVKGVVFNGVENEAHETFSLPEKAKDLDEFDFCKTNRKPYDTVVVACLARLAKVKGIKISSDGTESEWSEGIALANKILGDKFEYPRS